MTRSSSADRERQARGLRRRHAAPHEIQRLFEPGHVHGLEQVVDRVHGKRVDRILVEGRDEHEVGAEVGLDQPACDFEAGEPGHLDVEEDEIRRHFADHPQRVHAVLRLADDLRPADLSEQEAQFLARQLLVVDDQHAQGRRRVHALAFSETTSSGISIRADVPWPGTL